ncbi:MAG: glycosyltransferase family 2 protein [Sulfuricurvum sp.]|nr:glycosyltransferase family 2 protein [Sulfuricurvum sp.]
MELITQIEPYLEQKPEYKLTRGLFWPAHEKRQGEGGLRTKGYFKKSYDTKPLISVVTVVYNGQENLEQTINSVLDQTYDNIEHIIIDGASKDKTLEIIQKYDDKIDYWVSEPDGGIYKAMNKGASLASGEYIAFLNADDWYNLDTIHSVVDAIIEHHRLDYIFGNVDIYSNDILHSTLKKQFEQYKFNTPFGHPALFVQTCHLLTTPFNTDYKVIADYDFILELIAKKLNYYHLDKSLTNFRLGGVSSSANISREKFRLYYARFGLIRAVYSYLLATHSPLIKPINTLIHTFRYILKLSASR